MTETHGSEQKTPKLVFLIVNWNRESLLARCLESLSRYVSLPHNTLVVDNASSDGSVDMVKTRFPDIYLIENQDNLGYGKANNIGIQYLQEKNLLPDYLVFLNNDTVLQDGSLNQLITYLESQEDTLAAIPSVFIEADKLQTGVAGFELTLGTAFNYFFSLSALFPRHFRGFFLNQKYFRTRQTACTVDWISGVCLILKASGVQTVPEFPEDFFMYAEDLAFCRELRRQGRIIYFPLAQIYHLKDSTSAPGQKTMWLDSLFRYYLMQNQGRNAGLKLFLLKLIFLKGFGLRFLGYGLVSPFFPFMQARAQDMKLYFVHIWQGIFKT